MYRKILFILLFVSQAWGHTYYVSTSGNNANNGTSASTPWQTCLYVTSRISAGLFVAGDSILFKRGDYFEPTGTPLINFPRAGIVATAEQPVTFGAYGSGAKPILSLENATDNSSYTACVLFLRSGNKNLVFRDMEWRGSFRMYPWTAHGNIDGVLFDSLFINGDALHDSQPSWANTLSVFDNSVVADGGVIYVAADSFRFGGIDNFEVRYCVISHMNRAFGMFGTNKNIWIHHNKILNPVRSLIDIGQAVKIKIEHNVLITDGVTQPQINNNSGLKVQAQRGKLDSCVIRGNLIVMQRGTQGTFGFNNPAGTFDSVYNNTIVCISPFEDNSAVEIGWEFTGTSGATFIQNLNLGLGSVTNLFMANNIIVGGLRVCERGSTTVTYGDGTTFTFTESMSNLVTRGIWFKNNIFFPDNPSYPLGTRRVYQGSTITHNDTLFVSNPTSLTAPTSEWLTPANFNSLMNVSYGENNVNGDPLFENMAGTDSSDFRLQSISMGNTSGVAIPGYTHDLAGYQVPQTGSISVGCFQQLYDIPPAPTVTSVAASYVSTSSARMNGTVDPNGQTTVAWFEWGTSATLSTYVSIGVQSVGSGTEGVSTYHDLTSILSNTTYYFRAVATNVGGTERGEILSFTTSSETETNPNRKLLIRTP